MNLQALRALPKISCNVFKNSCRPYSFKFEMTPASRAASEEEQPAAEGQQTFRYNVCQPRTSPVERPTTAGDVVAVQKQSVKAAIEQQHLQPAMLPEYYQNRMERNALIHPEPEPNEEDRINKGHHPSNQRRFQVSKTYANATLPLKSVKLANPFPDPVKMMMSRTVSDDEKAEQMLAESRSQRNFSDWGKASHMQPYRSFSTAVRRWLCAKSVGRDREKCKKLGTTKKSCPRLKVANCPPRARTVCDRAAKQIHCKKQQAPYPAYSEFCHEELDEKPSECKMCPWKTSENPNFKPPKKRFHTSASLDLRRSGLEMDWNETSRTIGEETRVAAEETEEIEGMQCDMRKPKCQRPKNRRCPPTKEEIRAKKEKERKKKKPKERCDSSENVEDLLEETIVERIPQNIISLKQTKRTGKGHGRCKIRKFKYDPKCEKITRKDQSTRCPRKKKKELIHDCPPESKGCETEGLQVTEEYSLSRKDIVQKDKSKCPKIDMTVDRSNEEDDPCNLRRKGVTKICPTDLLKKRKRKPRKKTSGMITPTPSKTELPQPTTRVA